MHPENFKTAIHAAVDAFFDSLLGNEYAEKKEGSGPFEPSFSSMGTSQGYQASVPELGSSITVRAREELQRMGLL